MASQTSEKFNFRDLLQTLPIALTLIGVIFGWFVNDVITKVNLKSDLQRMEMRLSVMETSIEKLQNVQETDQQKYSQSVQELNASVAALNATVKELGKTVDRLVAR